MLELTAKRLSLIYEALSLLLSFQTLHKAHYR